MQRTERKNTILCLMPMVGGVIFGFIIMQFFGANLIKDGSFWGKSFFEELQYIQIQKKEYLWYLIKVRGLQIVFFVVMEWIGRKGIGTLIWAWMSGLGFGVTSCAMVEQWGYIGIVGSLLMMLPHYLLYLFAYIKYANDDCVGQCKYGKNKENSNGLYKKIKILGVVIIGILLECYVNPYFLKLFSKIFT